VIAPPRLATRLLTRRLLADERDELIGDLQEQFSRRATAAGPFQARLWYWRQAVALVWGFTVRRRDLISTRHERTRGAWAAANAATDVRHAWRSLRHSPSFAAVALLTLTCGIGLSTAVFSLVLGILVNPLPYANADRLVRLSEFAPGRPVTAESGDVSDVALGFWTTMDTALAKISPYSDNDITVVVPDGAANVSVADVGADFFSILAMPPLAGRVLLPSDAAADAAPVAVISEELALRSFGGVQAALGKTVGLETTTNLVVGVLARHFAFPHADVAVWRMGRQYRRFPPPGAQRQVFMRSEVIGLLRDGALVADADANGVTVATRIAAADPAFADGNVAMSKFMVRRLFDDLVRPVRPALVTLGAGMALVLIAACVNLANLLLARHTARQRELAVRVALGADRWRVARPVLFELTLISIGGGVAGALLAWWLLASLPVIAPSGLPRLDSIHFDVRAFLATWIAAFLTAVIVGLLPVLRLPATEVRELTSASGRIRLGGTMRSADRLRGVLVAGQIALAMVLLVGALLIGRSLVALLDVDLGYQPDGVLTLQAAHPFSASREPGRLSTYYREMLARLRQHPGVVAVGSSAPLPLHHVMIRSSVNVVGRPRSTERPKPEDMVVSQPISADYLKAIGTRVVKGRGFTADDTISAPKVALIDELVARKHFPDGDAIGQQLLSVGRDPWTIVGIVQTIRVGALGDSPSPVLYFPAEQLNEFIGYGRSGGGIAIRTAGDPEELIGFVRDVAREVDRTVPLFNVRPLNDDIALSVAQPRFFTVVLVLFAALALSTALLGIYGVLAYAVERRRTEFGVRRALGATERHIVALVMRRGLLLAGVGAIAGLAGAALGARLMQSLLYGVTAADPASYAGAAALILSIVLAASWLPVRRAIRIDPARALRVD